MGLYDPSLSHFDFDFERGRQGELWVADLRKALASDAIEVKADAKFVLTKNLYIEYSCRGRDGIWRDSGIAVTKSKWWISRWGKHDAATIVDMNWLKRVCRDAYNRGRLASMRYGENHTKGVLVTIDEIIEGRDKLLDEHA